MTDIAAAPPPTHASTPRRRIGDILLDSGVITAAQLQRALDSAKVTNGKKERLGQSIVRLGFATEQAVARALATQLRLEYFDGSNIPIDEELAAKVPAALAERSTLLPLRMESDGTLVVACADPTNVVALDDVRMAARVRAIRPIVAPATVLEQAVRKAYGFDSKAGELIDQMDVTDDRSVDFDLIGSEDAPVVRLAEGIISDAIGTRASDIHVEPGQHETVVRYRTDGVLHKVMTVPRAVTGPLVSRLKLMSGMDIAERRRPQDGRARFKGASAEVDLRVSSLPSLYGETVVIRLLRKGAERLSVSDVGFTAEQLEIVTPIIERPQGLVLITGPTGSGKTSTLYAFLAHLANEERNIITIEDPIEYELNGVNQSQVNERIDFTFAKALRTVLRQDPDVVMVGEIRDPETAELALQASLTGHLVFSTLHTNDAPSAIVRLRDLGIPPYLIASSMSLVMAQRLTRKLCSTCSIPMPPSEQQMSSLRLSPKDVRADTYRGAVGCPSCNDTGYKGRGGVFEILPIDGSVREHISNAAPESALRTAARMMGMHSLREDALDKAGLGVTTLDEVIRTTTAEISSAGSCPACGAMVEDEFDICPWCAADLRPDACATCRRELERGWKVCPSCGTAAHSREGGDATSSEPATPPAAGTI